MIYDCIPFFNEIDILNLRLHILDPYVDRFVIEESTMTFSGQQKELCFEKNKELFRAFLPKITYIVVNDDIADQSSANAKTDRNADGRAADTDDAGKNTVSDVASEAQLWKKAPTHARDVWQKNHLIYGLRPFSSYVRIDCNGGQMVLSGFLSDENVTDTTDAPDHVVGADSANTPVLPGTIGTASICVPASAADSVHSRRSTPVAEPEDIVIFGDCDEIPNPAALQTIFQAISGKDDKGTGSVYHLAQRNFYAFLNMEEKSGKLLSVTGDFPDVPSKERKWLGTKVTTVSQIPAEGIDRLRDLVPVSDSRSVRVADGGWHFGYMGGYHETNPAKRIGVKVKAAAHQEYNDREILAETMDHLYLGHDIFGRDAKFVRVPIDQTYSQYLLDHIAEYDYLIMPPIGPFRRLCSRLDLTIGRFWRKGWRHVLRKIRRNRTSGE